MKNIRFVLPLLVAVFLLLPLSKAKADAFTVDSLTTTLLPFDTVNCEGTDVPVFGFSITTTVPDTLQRVVITSLNELASSVKQVYLYVDTLADGYDGDEKELKSVTLDPGDLFETSDTVQFSASNMYVMDTAGTYIFYFVVDVNDDSICADSVRWHGKGMEAMLDIDDISLMDGTSGPADTVHCSAFDPATLSGIYRVYFDTEPPQFTLMAFDLVEDTESNGIIDLGDSVRAFVQVSPDVNDTMVKSYFAAFDTTDWVILDDSTAGFVYRHRIPLATVGLPLDVGSNFYYLIFTAEDIVGNQGRDSFLVSYPIDTKKPVFPTVDSVEVELVYDLHGSGEGVISIGDSLKFTTWMTNNPFGEIETVWVNLDSLNSGVLVGLADISANRIWTWTYEVVPGNLDTLADSIACWFVAEDNAGNLDSARSPIGYPIDIVAPSILASDIIYARWVDIDVNNVMNLGDSVIIRVDASGILDLADSCEVMVNLLRAGLGGPYNYCMEDSAGAGIYRLLWELKPDPQDSAIDVLANVADVDIALKDDAGNKTTITSNPIDKPVDTKRPVPVGGLAATPKKDCVIELTWTTQDSDLPGGGWFAIFSDGGTGGPINYDDTIGTTTDIVSKRWSTGGSLVLDDSTTYKFVVQTIDNANNWEKPADTVVVSAHADCQAPVVCITYPESGLTFGPWSPLFLIGESNAPDVEDVEVLYRFKDTDGMGTPGPWYYYDNMYSSGGLIYKDTIPNLPPALGDTLKGEGTYELIAYAYDSLGNVLDTLAAYDSCHFEFNWFFHPVPVFMVSVNDTVSPQSGCGYNVYGDSNKIVVDVTGATPADSFTLDVYVIIVPPDSTARVYYVENITMPNTFYLDVTYWEPGTQKMFVKSINEAHNIGVDTVDLCVPEWQVPVAEITSPKDGQRVHRALTSMNPVLIRAELSPNSPFGVSGIAKVEFEYSLNATDWILIETKLDTSSSYWQAEWDNSDTTIFTDGLKVYLRAKFYIPDGSFGVTSMIYVFIDASVPVIDLKVQPIVTIDGVDKVRDPVDLFAYVRQSTIDIRWVYFYSKLSTDPDIFFNWNLIDVVPAVNDADSATIFVVRDWEPADEYDDQLSVDIRAIAEDASGNMMFDYDGDGYFDDGWFSLANACDTTVFTDNQGPQPAIDTIFSIAEDGSDTIIFVNPSTELGGSGIVFVQAKRWIAVTTHCLPAGDSLDVEKVEYDLEGDELGTRTTAPYRMKFWPPPEYFVNGWQSGTFTAKMYDKLGNDDESDVIEIYFLDVTGNQVVITSPANNSYKKGSFTLQGAALDAYSSDIKSVTYQYGVVGSDTTWYDICTAPGVGSCTWHTYNNDLNQDGDFTNDDGWYPLRAVSEDNAGNPAVGPVIRVNVTNHNPIAYMIMPDDSTIIGGNINIKPWWYSFGDSFDVKLRAVAKKYSPSSAGIDYVDFRYKLQTSGTWTTVPYGPDTLTLYQDSIYANVLGVEGKTSGWYHFGAQAYDSASNMAWTDTLDIFIDNEDPQGKLMYVNGDYNSWYKDITEPDTALLVARAWDMPADYNAGLDSVQFIITDFDSDYPWTGSGKIWFMGSALPGDTTGQYYITWNHAGVPPGTYWVYLKLVDGVNNKTITQGWPVEIRDITVPVGVVRAFHQKYIYASTENQVDYLQLEYKPAGGALGGSDWIKLSLADTVSGFVDLWSAPWDPMSLAGTEDMDYYVRAVPVREEWPEIDKGVAKYVVLDNFIAPEVLITVTPTGEVTTQGTEDIGPMSFTANLAYDSKGTISLTQTTEKPYLLAIYTDLDTVVQYVTPLTLDKVIDEDTYNGFFDAKWICAIAGRADFFASIYGSPIYIEDGGFVIHKVFKAFGTNGWVWSHDGTARIKMPEGVIADTLANLLIFPAQKPDVTSIPHIDYLPVGNENGMLQQFYLYWASNNGNGGPGAGGIVSPESNIFSTIVLSYNGDEVQIDESELQVGRWNKSDLKWEFTGIRDLVVDTENNTVEFKTNQMGLYAVVQNVGVEPFIATIAVEPNCSDYTYEKPVFKATIKDNYSGVNENSIVMKVGLLGGYMMDIYDSTGLAHGFCYRDTSGGEYYGYDPVSGILKVENCGQPFECSTYVVTVSARNNYGILATATDTFIVDCTPPEVDVPHGYVYKNPVFTFTVKDAESGVDKNYVYVDLYSATMSDSQYTWSRKHIETVTPTGMEWVDDTTVRISSTYHLRNAQYLDVVVYNGNYSYYEYYYDEYRYYCNDDGVMDCVGNYAHIVERRFAVDWAAPACTLLSGLSDRPIIFRIEDYESGIKTVVADPEGASSSWDPSTGIFLYTPSDGDRMITITVTDTVGNVTVYPFTTEAEVLTITDTYNWPNPFDPSTEVTTIEIDNSKSADITVKIYDFAGDYVTTLSPVNGEYRWKGTTEDGEMVANGVYLCYIKAKDGSNTVTEVIKIAVVKKD